jgi:hypothetical protein
MRRITASLIIFLLVIQCGFVTIDAQHHAAHVHGNAQLKMVATSDALQIQVTIPAESTVGFEYAPKSQAEMEKVEEVKSILTTDGLFTFFRSGRFLKQPSALRLSPLTHNIEYTYDHTKSSHHTRHDHTAHSMHAEFILTRTYSRKTLASITHISTQLFSFFRDIKQIEVTIVSDENIAYSTLTPHESQLKLPQRI